MIIKALGIADIIIAIIFTISTTLNINNWFPDKIVLYAGLFLLIKGIIFALTWDFASLLDIICGIIILLSLPVHIPMILSAIVIILLLQKGFFSIVS